MNNSKLINPVPIIKELADRCLKAKGLECSILGELIDALRGAPAVDAVEAKKYDALVEMYHDLRENFIDYVCSGSPNVAPYCLNRCQECADHYGWCKKDSVYCKGFNPAEVIIDGERKDNGTV